MTWQHGTWIYPGVCIVWPWPQGAIDYVWGVWVQSNEFVGVSVGQFVIVVVVDAATVYDRRFVLCSSLSVDEAERFEYEVEVPT